MTVGTLIGTFSSEICTNSLNDVGALSVSLGKVTGADATAKGGRAKNKATAVTVSGEKLVFMLSIM